MSPGRTVPQQCKGFKATRFEYLRQGILHCESSQGFLHNTLEWEKAELRCCEMVPESHSSNDNIFLFWTFSFLMKIHMCCCCVSKPPTLSTAVYCYVQQQQQQQQQQEAIRHYERWSAICINQDAHPRDIYIYLYTVQYISTYTLLWSSMYTCAWPKAMEKFLNFVLANRRKLKGRVFAYDAGGIFSFGSPSWSEPHPFASPSVWKKSQQQYAQVVLSFLNWKILKLLSEVWEHKHVPWCYRFGKFFPEIGVSNHHWFLREMLSANQPSPSRASLIVP